MLSQQQKSLQETNFNISVVKKLFCIRTYRFAKTFKRLELICLPIGFALVDNVYKVVREHKRHTFTSKAELLFKVAEDVAKVDVK